ncbi:MAG: sialidase family protein [Verrucomicrobia bacterium]|nr:sialidase family protein [Verrucomicrobiota bacterium]
MQTDNVKVIGATLVVALAMTQPSIGGSGNPVDDMAIYRISNITVRVSDPVVVALSEAGETRWGYHQFPALSRLPDGRLLVTFNDRPDRDDAYGTPGPAYVSADGGLTWNRWTSPEPLLTVSHSVISQICDGEYLCVPISPSLDVIKSKVELPEVAGRMNVYGELMLYRLSDCSPDVQAYMTSLPAVRWSPASGAWERQTIAWDTREALIRTRPSDFVIPRPYIDNPLLKVDGMLLYPDFHLQHLLPGGKQPKNYACWCMMSDDNGRSWKRRGLIAHDPSGDLMMGEPCLLPTSDGKLACIIRCADHQQKPMRIAYSADTGKTWSDTQPLGEFGVMPQAALLANGVAVLAFGRPGVHLLFSPDGTAQEWVGPVSLIAGNPNAIREHTCGYTRLLPVSDDSILITYADFQHVGEDGRLSKAIVVRKIQVSTGRDS